jgi:hypothetical protein
MKTNKAKKNKNEHLLCLSSFCVMYLMLSVFILIFFCFVCLHYVSCTQDNIGYMTHNEDKHIPVVCRILASISDCWFVCVFSPVGWLQYIVGFVCLHYVSCTQCRPCSFLFFLICLSSFCVMYLMLSVFILIEHGRHWVHDTEWRQTKQKK